MASGNDFSAIMALMDIRRLYEEQEARFNTQMMERDELIGNIEHDINLKREQIFARQEDKGNALEEISRLQGDTERVQQEAQQRIAQLQERVRDITAKLGEGKNPALFKKT